GETLLPRRAQRALYADLEHDSGRWTRLLGRDHAPAEKSGPRSGDGGLDQGLGLRSSMSQTVRIALDAMGGDHGPAVVVAGGELALARRPDTNFLFFSQTDH